MGGRQVAEENMDCFLGVANGLEGLQDCDHQADLLGWEEHYLNWKIEVGIQESCFVKGDKLVQQEPVAIVHLDPWTRHKVDKDTCYFSP